MMEESVRLIAGWRHMPLLHWRSMNKTLLFAICMLATPCAAAEVTLRPMPPFQRSEKTCLSVYYDGDAAYWFNHCTHAVSVRWDDEAKCRNWSCQSEIPANARSEGTISRHVRWCECAGELASCHLPPNGC
jgi:hypothetical protein